MARQSPSDQVYQLKVTLQEIEPPIWRRFQVVGSATLADLHLVLQGVMGWENYHLYQFVIGKRRYGVPDPERPDIRDSAGVELSQVAPQRGSTLRYDYDFGDGWEHGLLVEEIAPRAVGKQYPRCVLGARACPPEDCGGTGGYAELLEVIGDPGHERHHELMEWIGGPFDAERFDLDAVNDALQARIRSADRA